MKRATGIVLIAALTVLGAVVVFLRCINKRVDEMFSDWEILKYYD